MDTSSPYQIISEQSRQSYKRRTLHSLIICHEYSAIASTYHYPVHNALQEQARSRTCTESASTLTTRGLHPFILHYENSSIHILPSCRDQYTIYYPWSPTSQVTEMFEYDATASSRKYDNWNKSNSAAAARTKKQSKKKKKDFQNVLFKKLMMRSMPRKRDFTRSIVSGRLSSNLILVSMIQFTTGGFLIMWWGKYFTTEWFRMTAKHTLSSFSMKTEWLILRCSLHRQNILKYQGKIWI